MKKQNKTTPMPLSAPVVSAFCAQLALLIRGGLSAHESLLLLGESTADDAERKLLTALASDVGGGAPLYTAMAQSGRFAPYAMAMVRIGEAAGRLDSALGALATYYERTERLRQSVKRAVIHPLIMFALLMAIIAVLLVQVLPVFAQVYAQLGAKMSALAALLLRVGEWLGRSALYIGTVLVAFGIIFFLVWRRESGRTAVISLLRRFPLLRSVFRQLDTSRFSFAMALMLHSGLSIDQAVEFAAALFSGAARERVLGLHRALARGDSLSSSLINSGLFSPVDARLLYAGARVGALDTAMEALTKRSEEAAEHGLARVVDMVQPMMVTLMAVVAGMVLLSVMLPLLGIMAAI